MKKIVFAFFFCFSIFNLNAQTSCEDVIKYVKSKDYGTTYYSYSSEAIRKVTFYSVYENYKYYYFAIVQFTSSYKEYIYQVGSNTKLNYSYSYLDSAGKAFWEYIHPYNGVLDCAPRFD